MSGYVTGLVLRNSTLKGAPRFALVVIADTCNDDGKNGWPSMETISARAGFGSRRTAQRAVQLAVEAGELIREDNMGGPVDRPRHERTHRYTIPIERWIKDEAARLGDGDTPPPRSHTTPPAVSHRGVNDTSGADPAVSDHPNHPITKQRASRVPTKGSRGSRIPDGFAITSSMREWARDKGYGFDLDAETENFVDYWRAKAGSGGAKLDWVATWRTWMRRHAERHPGLNSNGHVSAVSSADWEVPAPQAFSDPFDS